MSWTGSEMMTADEIIQEKIIAILRGVSSQEADALSEALYEGGIRFVEVAFDPSSEEKSMEVLKSISLLRERFDGHMHVGAGTVLTPERVRAACGAGAEFIISPDTDRRVIEETKALGLLSIPGAMTPTEAAEAWKHGADLVKIFPASSLGPDYIRAMLSSLTHLKLLATGGICEDNISAFRKAGCAGFGIGGSLTDRAAITRGSWEQIRQHAENLVRLAR